MCGIAGYFAPAKPQLHGEIALNMLRAIEHRGPDDQGAAFFDLETPRHLHCATAKSAAAIRNSLPVAGARELIRHHLAFLHCRYSIVDLTPGGHQPMANASGEVCVSFNGEIYNYVELRAELESAGAHFSTRSDTEVLLCGYLHWGTNVFRRLNGQWALSLYDGRDRRLWLSRDRLGKVPLYYAVHQGSLYWASEIKAIAEACGPSALTVRTSAVDDYVRHGWRDRDGTFWNEVHDFPPAHYAEIGDGLQLQLSRYWALPSKRLSAGDISPDEAARGVAERLTEALRIRTRADVPVAFELSGGVDSSSIVALAASSFEQQVTAYHVAFTETDANEQPYADAVAARFGSRVDLRVLRPEPDDFWRDADDFMWLEEEPFHAPNLHTNQALRRHMKARGTKVVISGAAGDELFAGYPGEYFAPYLRYLAGASRWRRLAQELWAKRESATWKQALLALATAAVPGLPERLQRSSRVERSFLAACYAAPPGLQPRADVPPGLEERMQANMGEAKMNYWLRSSNKTNFGIPIEPRAPFLDYQVVDFAFGLPFEYLIRDGWHKWILRQAMAELLPPSVLWRRQKMGFPFPMTQWLLASRRRALGVLTESSCPFVRTPQVSASYDDMARTVPYTLWRLVCLGLWWRRVVERRPTPPRQAQ